MLLSGFTFIRNGIRYDYPFVESIRSMLPLVEELVIVVGNSDDGTRKAVEEIGSPKVRIIDSMWDDSLRSGGRILAQQTNLALSAARHPWCLYLQGDEVLHEHDHKLIQRALHHYSEDHDIEGLLFDYLHFYGSYGLVGRSRKWYRREIRVVRNVEGMTSWGDAQGFRRHSRKLRVAHVPARIFHYGWVKPPTIQSMKLESFHKLWHDDAWVAAHEQSKKQEYDYAEGGRLDSFSGTHPAVMKERISRAVWSVDPTVSESNARFKDKLLDRVESTTGWRIGEYRNYTIKDTFDPDD